MGKAFILTGMFLILAISSACAASSYSDPLPVSPAYGVNPKPNGNVVSYDLTVKGAPCDSLPGVTVQAVTYNGTVPGPTLRVKDGDTLRV